MSTKATKRFTSTEFHYVAPKPNDERTLCGKAADSPTLSDAWTRPLGVVISVPTLCDECRAVLLNAQARLLFDTSRELVEDAQHTLYRAAQTIGGVAMGGSIANTKMALLGGKVHELWRYLSYSFSERHLKKLTLDNANADPFLRGVDAYGMTGPLTGYITQVLQERRPKKKAVPSSS